LEISKKGRRGKKNARDDAATSEIKKILIESE